MKCLSFLQRHRSLQRLGFLAACVALAGVLAGCAGKEVIISNYTTIGVRAIVLVGGNGNVVSMAPWHTPGGDYSLVDTDTGSYTVIIIPDQEWLDYAKTARQALTDRLAHADNLSGPEMHDLIQRLSDIAQKLKQYQDAATSKNSCSGSVTRAGLSQNVTGGASITTAADGSFVVTCQ